ncbi:MAG: hypothetical protein JRI25_14855 [Deltaproteobacteria bacterium]|nr:hypothetical protein [Deltaproteobacteria bacterium]
MRRLTFLFAVLVGGCLGEQMGDEAAVCAAVGSEVIALDEVAPGGFSPNDVLTYAAGTHAEILSWESGGAPLTLTVTHDGGDVLWVDYEWEDDGSGQELMLDCPDQLEIRARVTFATEDGSFDEGWWVTLASALGDQASFFQTLDLDALGGTYEVTEVDPDDFDAVDAHVSGRFDEDGSNGEIVGQAEGSEGSGPEGVAYAENFDIATWDDPSSEE